MTRAAPRGAIALWLVAGALGCRGIPDYRFADDAPVDAASDAGLVPPADALDDADGASDDAATPDAPTPGACPGDPPAYATACCGAVPCAGECAAACAECAARCGAGEACCAKRNNVQCKRPEGFVCN